MTIESGQHDPGHMNIDPPLPSRRARWISTVSRQVGYKKFGDYGDVIIYRPNGITDAWASVGLLPLSKQHPIIQPAMTWTPAKDPAPMYINTLPYRNPNRHLRSVAADNSGYTILSTANRTIAGQLFPAPGTS